MATHFPVETILSGCKQCHKPLGFEFSFAFQPIVDDQVHCVFGYEALVRGCQGQGASEVLSKINDGNRYVFDQACRVKAIQLASELQLDKMLSINFLPNAVYEPAHCIRSTLDAAEQFAFPTERLMFEITESEYVADVKHMTRIFSEYKAQGFTTALDDFGAGHAGLNLLASFVPDIIKIDMELVRGIDSNPVKQSIARGVVQICNDLGIRVLAEGLETAEEVAFYQDLGVSLMQGYYFAKPGFEYLPAVMK
ncbi:diguanylate phosphodiesterase [Thiomicrospira aerophila AL3]|uniref:Diguanylate phosphodiesterase n=1 Tax=Thiomicrospira aerophila AL3 TaxID=717772 RepID=W0DU56_9GAMM|nr:EAL domain-containing protein [Thiomicrospira aerophila]AHF00529.1 diguanylate phosphodiesterase [Thiomicrospira aerophila AL3]